MPPISNKKKHSGIIKSTAFKTSLTVFIVVMVASCEKFVEIDPPIDRLKAGLVFTNSALATASVTGLYSKMANQQRQFGGFVLTLYPALSADELRFTSTSTTYDPFYKNAIPGTSLVVASDIWKTAYDYVYHANACIEGLASAANVPVDVQAQLMGEAKFMRAFLYFYLVNLFGDVPLITATDYNKNIRMPRTSTEEVYQQVISDLLEAQSLMKPAYPTTARLRPNKWTVKALLSRVYLYRKEWAKAEVESDSIINSGMYTLQPRASIANIFFNATSASVNNEAIWQINIIPNYSQEATTFLLSGTTGKPMFEMTDTLMYGPGTADSRKTNWIRIYSTSYAPYKFKARSGISTTNSNENITVFRLAEQYLIRAEARAQQNKLPAAITDIGTIRARATGSASTFPASVTQGQVLDSVFRERRMEFFAEWGHRWFDLKRSGRDTLLPKVKPLSAWTSNSALYPIPYSEIQLNNTLTQNPGY